MIDISFGDDLAALDEAIEQVPNKAAVFLLWPKEGEPYLARTAMLGRRLRRLLKEREKPSRLLNLRQTVQRIEYALTASRLESSVRMYDLARQHFPDKYAEVLKLRLPPYVKIVLQNEFPRSQITTHVLSARRAGTHVGGHHLGGRAFVLGNPVAPPAADRPPHRGERDHGRRAPGTAVQPHCTHEERALRRSTRTSARGRPGAVGAGGR